MIKNFETYINEDYFSKLANRKENGEVRKENTRTNNYSTENIVDALNTWYYENNTIYDKSNSVKKFATYVENYDNDGNNAIYLDFSHIVTELNEIPIEIENEYGSIDNLTTFADNCQHYADYVESDDFFYGSGNRWGKNMVDKFINELCEELENLSNTFSDWYEEKYEEKYE